MGAARDFGHFGPWKIFVFAPLPPAPSVGKIVRIFPRSDEDREVTTSALVGCSSRQEWATAAAQRHKCRASATIPPLPQPQPLSLAGVLLSPPPRRPHHTLILQMLQRLFSCPCPRNQSYSRVTIHLFIWVAIQFKFTIYFSWVAIQFSCMERIFFFKPEV